MTRPGTSSTGSAQRARRARIASVLLARAPQAVDALDWTALDRAPDWLACAPDELAAWQRQVGAVLYARTMRLWIDGPRLAAVRDLLGEPFLAALMAQPEEASISTGLVPLPRIDCAAHVVPSLQSAGGSVLLAAMAHGPMRNAASALLAPVVASPMAHDLAETVVAQARAIAERAAR